MIANPISLFDFHPILLYNAILKIVTKTITNRLKPHLNNITNPNQSAFVPNRLITNNIILVYKSLHTFHKRKSNNKGYVGIKLEMEKAYDRL